MGFGHSSSFDFDKFIEEQQEHYFNKHYNELLIEAIATIVDSGYIVEDYIEDELEDEELLKIFKDRIYVADYKDYPKILKKLGLYDFVEEEAKNELENDIDIYVDKEKIYEMLDEVYQNNLNTLADVIDESVKTINNYLDSDNQLYIKYSYSHSWASGRFTSQYFTIKHDSGLEYKIRYSDGHGNGRDDADVEIQGFDFDISDIRSELRDLFDTILDELDLLDNEQLDNELKIIITSINLVDVD